MLDYSLASDSLIGLDYRSIGNGKEDFRICGCFVLRVYTVPCSVSRSQISAYVRGTLDSVYLNKNSAEYLEMIGGTAEECEAEYKQYIANEVEYFKSCMDIDEVSEGTFQRMVKIFETLYSNSKYEVGEVTKSSDRFLVSVTVYPIDVIYRAEEGGIAAFQKSFSERASRGEFDSLSDAEREELWADGIISEVEKNLDSIGYLEPVDISLQVISDNDKYSLSYDDLVRMDELIIQY